MRNLTVVAAALAYASTLAAGQDAVRSLSVEDALSVKSFTYRTPIGISPDGEWLAYTLEDPRRRTPPDEMRYSMFAATGAFVEALGSDVWLSKLKTGETKNLGSRSGTTWAPVWSPDGKRLAFYSDRTGKAHLWLWDRATGDLRQIPDVIVRPFFNFEVPRWTPDSRSIIVKALPQDLTLEEGLDLLFGPHPSPAARGADEPTVVVFRSPAQESSPRGPARADPRRVDSRHRYLADLARIDIESGKVERLVRAAWPLGHWISPDGRLVAFTDHVEIEENTQQPVYDIVVVSLADGARRVIAPRVRQNYGISVSWSPDSRLVAYTTSGPQAKGEAFVVPVAGGEPRRLGTTHPPFAHSHRAPLWNAAGDRLYFVGAGALWSARLNDGSVAKMVAIDDEEVQEIFGSAGGRFWSPDAGRSMIVAARHRKTKALSFHRIDLESAQVRRLMTTDTYVRSDFLFKIGVPGDASHVVYVLESATRGQDAWLAGPDFSAPRRVTTVNRQLDRYLLGESRLVTWTAIDGQSLQGALLLPAGYQKGTRYPLIVNVYGGSLRSQNLNRFGLVGGGVENMQLLATRGYAVLLPDTPLHVGTPMRDLAATVMPGVQRVIDLGIADPERLGVMGHSYGGYSTLALITQTTRFKAAVSSAGFSNLVTLYGRTGPDGTSRSVGWAEEGQGRLGGSPWEFRARYLENSPYFYLDRVQTPLLMVHGALDDSAPIHLAEETFVALRRLGKPVVLARYEGEDHWQGTWGFANVKDYWNRVIEWFDSHLAPR